MRPHVAEVPSAGCSRSKYTRSMRRRRTRSTTSLYAPMFTASPGRGTRPNASYTRPPTVVTSSCEKSWPSSSDSSSIVRPPADPEAAALLLLDLRLLVVVLVVDLADDLLEDVLDRDEPRRAAVLVAHDRDVRSARLEVAQLRVDRLRDRDERAPGARASASRASARRRR